MKITYRLMLIAIAVLGIGFGLSFGAGVAYGHGNPKTAAGGLTQTQLNSLLGINTSAAAATGGTGGAATTGGGAATRPGAGTAAAGGAQALATSATGQITAISGNTVTIQTRQGTEKVNLSSGTTIQKLVTGTTSDLKVGDSIIASGSRNADGSFDAKQVGPLPSELQALIGGGAGGGGGATATPTGR
jgi:hypothetical protein